jgi:anti-sigma B factor antagonist
MLDERNTRSCQTTPSALRVAAHATRDEIVLAFSGDADVYTAPLFAHALRQASENGHSRVAVDLADLEFIDTHCLSIIFGAHEKLRDRGAELVLRSPQPSVRRLLDILERQDLIELG